MRRNRANSAPSCNPYESPQPVEPVFRAQAHSLLMRSLRIGALALFALATLAGMFAWIYLQQSFPAPSVFDALPKAPVGVMNVVARVLLLSTPAAMLLLAVVWHRIPLALWIVIGPLLMFDIWASMLPANNIFRTYGWGWPWPMQLVAVTSSLGMPVITLAAFIALIVRWRHIPQALWWIIVPALAFDVWFICWWIDYAHVL